MSDNTLMALVLGGFGLLMLAIIVASLREAAAMRRWPVAPGRIVSSSVERYEEVAGTRSSGSRTRMTLYRPVVTYEYEVGGHRFRGDRITQSPGLNRGAPDLAEQVVRRYPSGTAVDVRYDPARPGDSVLEPRVPASWKFALAIALLLLGLAARSYFR